jgi:hypothetical protein
LLAWNLTDQDPNARLFRNNTNDTFSLVSADALTSVFDGWSVATTADVNNDGDPDLLVSPLGHAVLFTNDHGIFKPAKAGQLTSQSQILPPANDASVDSAWADYDNDGWMDVVLNTSLYRNNGDGTFSNVTVSTLAPTAAYAARAWGDYDNDGYLDLFVLNWAHDDANLLYHNNGNGTFTERATTARVNEGPVSPSPWTCGWADYDNDGFLDLYVANNNSLRGDSLYHNDGNGTFSRSGAWDALLPTTNVWVYGCAWGDYDNDGFLDLYLSLHGAGNAFTGNLLYHNNGDGTFTRVGVGSPTGDADWFGGCSWADYDNDGFLDLYVAASSGRNVLYHNGGNSNAWVKAKCVGTVSNRAAIGAKVRVYAHYRGQDRQQLREITGGDSDGNSQPLLAHFGLGDATNIDTVRIEWPSGIVQDYQNVAPRQFPTLVEPALRILVNGAWNLTNAFFFDPGTPVTLSVPTNLVATSFQWQFNGVDMPGETQRELVIPVLAAGNVGRYNVQIQGADPTLGVFTAHIATNRVVRIDFAGGPVVQEPSVRPDGKFQFTLSGEVGKTYRIETTQDFAVWTTVGSPVVPTSPLTPVVVDTVPGAKAQFFRATQQ